MSKDKRPDRFPGALQMMVLRTLKRQPLHGYTVKRTSSDLPQIEERLRKGGFEFQANARRNYASLGAG